MLTVIPIVGVYTGRSELVPTTRFDAALVQLRNYGSGVPVLHV